MGQGKWGLELPPVVISGTWLRGFRDNTAPRVGGLTGTGGRLTGGGEQEVQEKEKEEGWHMDSLA